MAKKRVKRKKPPQRELYLKREKYVIEMGHAQATVRYDPKTCDLQVGCHVHDIDRCSAWLYEWGQRKYPDRFRKLGHMAVDHGMVMQNNRMWISMERIPPVDFRDFMRKIAAMYVVYKSSNIRRMMR